MSDLIEKSDIEAVENVGASGCLTGSTDAHIKLDPHGFPLRPQPTDDPLGASSSTFVAT